ncbi:Crp/Fnr family transcriptional regulator [Bosea vaviloviae]|uniref:Crp/Fnr family transcriptional regulator n=1 Tax=Bosea vaviloviae TaxID=1526658 RepID=UPI000A9101D8|nr:Crp/Fnr family transcriptional regulator [Bosea vaviloviae]
MSELSDSHQVLQLLLRKLELRAPLEDADRVAFLGLPSRVQKVEPSVYLVREGDRPDHSCVILQGFALRHKTTETGERQILSFHLDGDFVDLEGALLNVADHNVQTLTRCDIAFIPRSAVRELILARPTIGMAMWVDTLIDASVFREWILNVGKRDGFARVAHLLCEIGRRLEVAGLANSRGFDLPMTQEQLADATGMSVVHVSRVLKRLAGKQLIKREKRSVQIPDWERLRKAAGFSELYLHLDQVARGSKADRSL